MMNIVKYGAIATLAIIGTLASGASATSAVLAGGLAIASKGVEQICDTASKEKVTTTLGSLLPNETKGKTLKNARERAKKGVPPMRARDKRIACR